MMLGEDALCFGAEFMSSAEIVRCQMVNKHTRRHFGQDHIWEMLLRREICAEIYEPPGASTLHLPELYHHLAPLHQLFVKWRLMFDGYSSEEIRVVADFWRRMEAWLQTNAPVIFQSLNPPASLAQIAEAEEIIGRPIPRLTKLLYLFHNGQKLFFDEARFRGFYEEVSRADMNRSIFNGLFGGYQFYEELVNVRFLSLQYSAQITKGLVLNSVSIVSKPAANTAGDNLFSPQDEISPFEFEPREDCQVFAFACNAYLRSGITKVLATADGTAQRADGLFTNIENMESFIPLCSPPIVSASTNSASFSVAAGGTLFKWLHEYLRRLETGIFEYKPIDLTHQNILTEAEGNYKMINLFESGQGGERDSTLVQAVTNGIEITSSSIFVPHRSNENRLFWTYSIRMRLIEDHPSRPAALRTCQLETRHWKTQEPRVLNGVVTGVTEDEIEGEGVVGLFPTLSITNQNQWPFTYQSCFTSRAFPASLRGHVNFRSNANQIAANVEPIPFLVPEILF